MRGLIRGFGLVKQQQRAQRAPEKTTNLLLRQIDLYPKSGIFCRCGFHAARWWVIQICAVWKPHLQVERRFIVFSGALWARCCFLKFKSQTQTD